MHIYNQKSSFIPSSVDCSFAGSGLKNVCLFIFMVLALVMSACIDDSFTSSPADQPRFSTDTLRMGTVFTAEQTATHRFVVYNPHNKGLNISHIAMNGDNAPMFRLNVDGISGKEFHNVEIRANDSIFVFVSADIPETGECTARRFDADLDFMVNGKVSTVVISADGQDVRRLKAVTFTEDTCLDAGTPYQVTDSLVVAQGVTLTLNPGVMMLFHDNASLIVHGTLLSMGTPEVPVHLTGDRMGNVITDVSFDLMSRQWNRVDFCEDSKDNYLAFTDISNTSYGVNVYGDGENTEVRRLVMVNSRICNSGGCTLTAVGASVEAYGCEFSDASNSLVYLIGGDHRFDLCTTANYYLFSAVSGASWRFEDFYADEDSAPLPTKALITNSISYGRGADVIPGDLSGYEIYFKRCLFKSAGTDDDNFQDSLWDSDPLFYTVREDYIFDYRLRPESPAIGAAYVSLSEHPLDIDYYGVPRGADLGAYTFVAPVE